MAVIFKKYLNNNWNSYQKLFFKNKKLFSKTVFKHTVNIYKFFEVFNIAIGEVENKMIWFAITPLQNFKNFTIFK